MPIYGSLLLVESCPYLIRDEVWEDSCQPAEKNKPLLMGNEDISMVET